MNSAIIGFLMYSNGSVEFSISTGNAEFSRCAANLRSTVWICYGQAHENSTCLYLPFSNTKAWHWGLKQKVCGVYQLRL